MINIKNTKLNLLYILYNLKSKIILRIVYEMSTRIKALFRVLNPQENNKIDSNFYYFLVDFLVVFLMNYYFYMDFLMNYYF